MRTCITSITRCSAPDVPPDADVVVELELLATEPARAPEDMTLAERAAKADRKRTRGNELFKAGDVGGALSAYMRGLKLLDTPEGEAPVAVASGDTAEANRVRALLLGNQAQCQWRLGDLAGAAASCERCLTLTPANVKVLYRAAVVLAGLNQLDDAADRLQRMLALAPGHAEALALRADLERRRAAQRASERELYGRMLRRRRGGGGASGGAGKGDQDDGDGDDDGVGLYDDKPAVAPVTSKPDPLASLALDDGKPDPLERSPAGIAWEWLRTSVTRAVQWAVFNPAVVLSIFSLVLALAATFVALPMLGPKLDAFVQSLPGLAKSPKSNVHAGRAVHG